MCRLNLRRVGIDVLLYQNVAGRATEERESVENFDNLNLGKKGNIFESEFFPASRQRCGIPPKFFERSSVGSSVIKIFATISKMPSCTLS